MDSDIIGKPVIFIQPIHWIVFNFNVINLRLILSCLGWVQERESNDFTKQLSVSCYSCLVWLNVWRFSLSIVFSKLLFIQNISRLEVKDKGQRTNSRQNELALGVFSIVCNPNDNEILFLWKTLETENKRNNGKDTKVWCGMKWINGQARNKEWESINSIWELIEQYMCTLCGWGWELITGKHR